MQARVTSSYTERIYYISGSESKQMSYKNEVKAIFLEGGAYRWFSVPLHAAVGELSVYVFLFLAAFGDMPTPKDGLIPHV